MRALRGADLDIGRGEFVAVMGPSGCGKSTLLNIIAGLDVPDEGEVVVAGESLVGKTESELAIMRRKHIGIVFQFFNLLEGMTVLENVVMPALIAGRKRKAAETAGPRPARPARASATRPSRRPACCPAVSGSGWRSPERWPTSRRWCSPTSRPARSTSEGGEEVLELFRRLHAGGQTILLVTHDQPVADAAQRIVRMRDGRVVDDGRQSPGA